MARGKCAVQAASRRANQSAERVLQLEDEIRCERLAWKEERASLESEVVALRGQLSRDVRSLAADAVQEAKAEAAALVTTTHDHHREQVLNGLAELSARIPDGIAMPDDDDFLQVAKAFGIELGEWLARTVPTANRETRRTTNGRARVKHEHLRAIEAQSLEGRAWVACLRGGRVDGDED